MKNCNKKVLMLHTGGTLGMRPRQPDQALAPDEFGLTVLKHVPEIQRLAQVEARILFNLDSSDLTPTHWQQLANTIAAECTNYDGIVITHGTDAMVYTACALSYALTNLPIPVILTGSQRPLADIHTDGRVNLLAAVDFATRPIPEVCIYFNGLLLRGNRAVKRSTFSFEAFSSPHFPPLAEIGIEVRMLTPPLPHTGPCQCYSHYDSSVAVIWLHPGLHGAMLKQLPGQGYRAVLLIAPGCGNVSVMNRSIADAIADLVQQNTVVAIGSQSHEGRVDLHRYAGGRLAMERGAVGIEDMTVEAAIVKLMWLLAQETSVAIIAQRLCQPIAGELSVPEPSDTVNTVKS